MYLILLLSLVGWATGAVLTVVQALGKRLPAAVWFVAPAGLLGLGAVGTLNGLTMTRKAMAAVDPEMLRTLAAAGVGASLHTTTFGLLAAGALLAMSAQGLGVALAGSTRDGDWTIPHAAPALAVVAVAAVALGVGTALDLGPSGALPGLFALLGAGATLAAASRWPDPGDARAAARQAHGRVAVGVLIGGSVILAGLLTAAAQEAMGFRALSMASVEQQAAMGAVVDSLTSRGRLLGWAAGLPAGLAAAATAWPVRKHLGDRSSWFSAAATAIVAAMAVGSMLAATSAQGALWRSVARTLGG